jgi:DNA-binding MarR family transcriptional regulator
VVETKQGINTVLSFGAKSVNPEILEQLLTGRLNIANFFEEKVNAIVNDRNSQFWLIIGQRGMGKTHLLKVLHSRIWHYSQENKLTISYFAEEEYGVANFFDFLLRILNSFIKWYDKDVEFLKSELENLQNTTIANQENYLKKIIKDYVGEKPLLIITENFGDILDQIGTEEQGRLRAWLYDNNNVSIIASSQSVSDNFDREDRPFYGFFIPYYLKSLSFEESYSFLISLAEIEKNNELVEHLKTKGKPQVRAIFDLVKGNHRLLVTFYHFLKTDMLAKVSENFIKTINDLKPYYETYIRYLPAQQQKILRYIALSRKPQLGIEISKNCFIEQKSLSKQLSELSRKRLIDIFPDPSDKRNKFYDISEPLLRISIEVGEHKEGITALFIDFLAYYYNVEELVKRNNRFNELLNNCNEKDQKNIMYEIEAIDKALNIKKEKITQTNQLFLESVQEGDYKKAKEIYFSNISESINEVNLLIALALHHLKNYEDAIKYFKKIDLSKDDAIKIEESQNAYYKSYSNSLINLSITDGNDTFLDKAIELTKSLYQDKGTIIDEYILSRLLKANNLIEKQDLNKAESLVNQIINIEFNSYPNEYKHLIMELVSYLWSGQEHTFTTEYLTYFNSLSIEKRSEFYVMFSKSSFFNLFTSISSNIEQDNKTGDFNIIIINWITNILINSKNITLTDLSFLIDFIRRNLEKIPELAVLEVYTIIYREVVLNKNETALYQLSKEQREFFEQKILKRK